jgi:hypothetical protein
MQEEPPQQEIAARSENTYILPKEIAFFETLDWLWSLFIQVVVSEALEHNRNIAKNIC